MATNASDGLPSRRAIAFAQSLVRSKPAELLIAEYIDILRQHVAKGRRENALSSAYHHLDRSSYWRAEHERTKEALRTIESENVTLRQEISTLKAKVERTKVAQPKKRKRQDGDVIPIQDHRRERSKTSQRLKDLFKRAHSRRDLNSQMLGRLVSHVFMRGIHQIHAALKAHHNKTDVQALTYGLLRAARALPQVVTTALQSQANVGSSEVDLARPVLVAIGRSFRALIEGFTRLTKVEAGVTVLGHVTYVLVEMYEKLVDYTNIASANELRSEVARAERQSTATKQSSKASKFPPLKGGPILDLFIRTLGGLIDELDPSTDRHHSLFEGFAYVVLSVLGSRMYLVIFGHPRGKTIEDEIMASISSDVLEQSDHSRRESSHDFDRRAARLEAPYLVHLLERIMSAAPSFLGTTMNVKKTKAKSSLTKGVLAIVAKERLQRTLVNCIFGNNEADEDNPFNDCLRKLPIPATPLPLPKVKEAEVESWFQEEMWRLLGWEILAREGDW